MYKLLTRCHNSRAISRVGWYSFFRLAYKEGGEMRRTVLLPILGRRMGLERSISDDEA